MRCHLSIVIAALVACSQPASKLPVAPPSEHARGSVEAVEPLHSFSADELRAMMLQSGLPDPITIANGVDLYRISYWTEHRGNAELVSGLYARPKGVVPRATAMWLNGTNPTRDQAPSMGKTGAFIAAIFAGNGFVLVSPDYVGLGISKTYHPYFDAKATVAAAIDLLRAVRAAAPKLGDPSSSLLLVGFSQGAYSTAVVQRALEKTPEAGVELRAAAALAPPLDLTGASLPNALQGKSESDSMYLAYLAHAYAKTYGHPLESLLTDDAAKLVATLFDGMHGSDDIAAKLPKNPRDLFRPEIAAPLAEGKPSWFHDALVANEAFRWAPKAPLRLYYGDSDVDVFPDDPKRAAAAMKALGGNVELVPVGAYDHNGTAFHALPGVLAWFEQLAPAH